MGQINRAVNKALKRKKWEDEARQMKNDGFQCDCGSGRLRATRKGVECRKCGRMLRSDEPVRVQAVAAPGEEKVRQDKGLLRKWLGF